MHERSGYLKARSLLIDLNHPDFLALLEQARKAEDTATPRKHHIVPSSYLKRWAEDGKIRVTEIDTRRSYLTAPDRAARETDYYRVESEDLDRDFVPPLLYETLFSDVEGWGKRAIDRLLVDSRQRLDSDLRSWFARYLALQHTRGHAYRQVLRRSANDMFKTMYEGVTDVGIRALLVERGMAVTSESVASIRAFLDELQSGEVWVQPQDAAVVSQAFQLAEPIAEELYERGWKVYRTPPLLLTCDEPVVLIGGPGLRRGERPGVATAGVVAFPLSPSAVLAMFRRDVYPVGDDELDHGDTAELNREIVAHAARWSFERPSRSVAARMDVPPSAEPTAEERFRVVKGPGEEIIRSYRPSRWANATDAPGWPVARWWQRSR